VHDDALVVVEYSPDSQVAHWRLAVIEPAAETSWPATQVVHAVHDDALVVLEYSPAPHATHWRLAVVEPVAEIS
jgi:hypothetical protein